MYTKFGDCTLTVVKSSSVKAYMHAYIRTDGQKYVVIYLQS